MIVWSLFLALYKIILDCMIYFVLLHSCLIALDRTGKPLKDIVGIQRTFLFLSIPHVLYSKIDSCYDTVS